MFGNGWALSLLAESGTVATAAASATAEPMSLSMKSLIILAVLVGSFVAGHFIAQSLRLADLGLRLGFALATLLVGIAVCVLGWPPKLGIDLSGGVVLVYEVDRSEMRAEALRESLAAVEQRLSNLKEPAITTSLNAKNQIEVNLPTSEDQAVVDELKGLDTRALTLKLADRRRGDATETLVYNVETEERPLKIDELIRAINLRVNPGGVLELTVRQFGAGQVEIIVPDVDKHEVDLIKSKISTPGLLEFRILASADQPADRRLIQIAQRTSGREVFDHGRAEGRWVALGEEEGPRPDSVTRPGAHGGTEILVKLDRFNITGKNVSQARPDVGDTGRVVSFTLDSKGAPRFAELTGKNVPDQQTGRKRQLGIVLDNKLLSAPDILSQISGSGQISGHFTEDKVNWLVSILNAGSLPAALQPEPISEQQISAQLGEDTIRQGRNSMIVSTVAVLVFMLIYYRFAGLVADFAVVMNMILAVAMMVLFKAAFTLPGLAGLVLTVGMAVDANVLIYERMREEAARGASFRMTIRNGFSRAMSTIVDSNMTTIMSGVVLFLVGTDQIKGFAVTLILGLMVSLYTAVFVARLIFDIVERKRWVTHLRMMQLIGETHIDFVRLRGPAIAASLVVIGIGLGAVIARGGGLFDIDFTGGSSVQIKFDEDKPQDIQHIRESLGDLPDLAVSGVGAHNSAFKQWEFKIDTSEQDIAKVEQKIEDVFGTDLATYGMKFGSLEPYTPPVPPSASAQSTSTGSPAGSATSPAVRDVSIPAAPAATPPAASTKTPVADPATTPPAAATPAATTPPTSPPPATPSGTPEKQEAPAGDAAPAKPDAGKQGAWRRGIQELRITLQEHLFSKVREARSVASLVGSTWMALQASSDGATPKADSTAAPAAAPAEGAPAAPKPEEAKPADSSPAAPSGAAPAATPSPASAPSDSAMPAETAKPTETAKQTESAEPPKAGLKTTLTFAEPISYNALHPMILNWLVEHKLDSEQFDISNPKHQTGSSSPFREWTLTTQLPADAAEKLLGDLQTKLVATPVFPSANNIGGKVAGKAQFLAMWALVASLVMIVIYVWIRFQNVMFGVAAVLALVHDVLVTIGFLALSKYLAPVLGFAMVDDFKISLAVVAALLTIIGYSINDTIVIFDRIREIRGKNPDLTETMINLSVNQTLGRTLLTSGTVLIGAMILYFGGGEGIHPFAYAMLIGLISGTYSTVYIASPVLLWLRKADEKKNRPEVASRVGAARKAAG